MNVSLRGTDCLQVYGIFFSSYLHIMHINVAFKSAALLGLQR